MLLLAACGSDGDDDDVDAPHAYISGSIVFGEDATSYVSVIDSLEIQTVDYRKATEFPGSSDVWVHGGAVFVARGEDQTIVKYTTKGHGLVEQASIGFSAYGLTDFGFWRNVFVAEDKAYFSSGASRLVVWNPTAMTIDGVIELPTLGKRGDLTAFPGYSDRSTRVRGGKLYQPIYWTSKDFFQYAPGSAIVVIDVATNAVVDTIETPCPGIDYASTDAAGNLYFSSWVYAPGAATLASQPSTCVFEVPVTGAPHVLLNVAEIADGREGGVLHFLPSGRAMLSVFHDEHLPTPVPAINDATFGPNWRLWSYDPAAGAAGAGAAVIDAYGWVSGAHYTFAIDGNDYMLVAAGDYGETAVYRLDTNAAPTKLFDARGWSTRLFKLR